ncbi:MAG: NAD(P)-binding domain-containing protein [Betaproteobacteria bacterium]
MNSSNERAPAGFIGLGIIGASMAGHPLGAGHPLHVCNRPPGCAERIAASAAARGLRALDAPVSGGAAGSFLRNNPGPRILPGLTLALRQYEALAEAGEGRSGTQALYKRYAR